MPDGSFQFEAEGLIGPNAIIQLAGPVDRALGEGVMAQVLDLCQISMPCGNYMIPQEDVETVHHTLWQLFPSSARAISQEAGRATAHYIRANRIPRFARIALRLMPSVMAEKMLTKAIERHAWTFCGSGTLNTERDGHTATFLIKSNPLAEGHAHQRHHCLWHEAVFAELFSSLLGHRYTCVETTCCAYHGDLCRFTVTRR